MGSDDNGGDVDTGGGERSGLAGWICGRSRWQLALGSSVLVLLIVVIIVLALVPASILGLVVNDSASFDGTPAVPDDETLGETGYELNDSSTLTVERQLSPGGQTKTISVNNPQRVYRKHITVQNRTLTAGVFATASTPTVTVAGTSRNPIAQESHREILDRFRSNLDAGGEDVTFENTATHDAVLVGSRTTVTEFRANISVGGEKRNFAIYVTKARTNGDIVIAIGGHPTAFADERPTIMRLIYAVEHQGG